LSTNIDSLKGRDPKGLYSKADRGEVVDLIGYSKNKPYEVPVDADLKIDTSSSLTLESSVETIVEFIKKHSRG
jgi:bifunctional enzyme CysN/CysC